MLTSRADHRAGHGPEASSLSWGKNEETPFLLGGSTLMRKSFGIKKYPKYGSKEPIIETTSQFLRVKEVGICHLPIVTQSCDSNQ